jgi:predicted amidophosphoribosyltransferase
MRRELRSRAAALMKSQQAAEAERSAAPAARATDAAKFCSGCGAAASSTDRFCAQCGTRIEAHEASA